MPLSIPPHDHVGGPLDNQARPSEHRGASSSTSVGLASSSSSDQISTSLQILPDDQLCYLSTKLNQRDQTRLGAVCQDLRDNLSAFEAPSFMETVPSKMPEEQAVILQSISPKSLARLKATNRRTYRMIASLPEIEDRLTGARFIDALHKQSLGGAQRLQQVSHPALTAQRDQILQTYAHLNDLLPRLRDQQYCRPAVRDQIQENLTSILANTTQIEQAEALLH